MNKNEFLEIVLDWQNVILKTQGIEREIQNQLEDIIFAKPIKILTGFRRSGKSFLIQNICKKLIENNAIRKENILFINFEDYRFANLEDYKAMGELFEIYIQTYMDESQKLLVIDEVQNLANWSKVVRTIYEKYGNDKLSVVLTGSNSQLLSAELGSNLSGRFIEIKILPFSFKEFLCFNKVNIANEYDFSQNKIKVLKLFDDFFKFGGLPESLLVPTNFAKNTYLEGILSKVILDDVVKRFNLRNVALVEKIAKFILGSPGNLISITRISNFLQQAEIEVKNDTISQYIECLEKTFAFYSIELFSWQPRKVFSNKIKYYAVDTAFTNLYSDGKTNYGKIVENIIFLELKRKFEKVYFYQSESKNKEIDFIAKQGNNNFLKIQVTLNLSMENKDRELSSFLINDKILSKGTNLLLSFDNEEKEISYEGITIKCENILKWLVYKR